MAENNKLKILYILDIMKKTDENHPVNSTQIAEQLSRYGIKAERKSIGRDLECLEDAGYSIIKCENHNLGWYMIDQEFEDFELKILADSVAAARFLTLEDSNKLIRKIKKLATKDGESIIKLTTNVDEAIKIADAKFKIKYDTIMRAIAEHKQIRFQYYELSAGNKKVLRKNGYVYQVSPYFLVLVDDQYYVVSSLKQYDNPTNFRLEMITNLEVLEEPVKPMKEVEELKKIGATYSIGDYIRESVHMWSGEVTNIRLRCRKECRHDILMKYGKNVSCRDDGEGYFIAHVKVSDNPGFYQWFAAYGSNVVIQSPESMRQKYIQYLKETIQCYESGGTD